MIDDTQDWNMPPHLKAHVGIKGCVSGMMFDLFNPTTDMVSLLDIGWGLAGQLRFGGQTIFPYSVAQHSVLLSHAVPPELAKVALMHDASEAYIGDMIAPLKVLLPEFEIREHVIQRVIFNKYGLDFNQMEDINRLDKLLCPHEAATAQPLQQWWKAVEIPDEISKLLIGPWSFEKSRHCFFARVDELGIGDGNAVQDYWDFCKQVGIEAY